MRLFHSLVAKQVEQADRLALAAVAAADKAKQAAKSKLREGAFGIFRSKPPACC